MTRLSPICITKMEAKMDNSEHLTVPPDGRPMEDQPKWRQDFPVDWPQDEYVTRRDFIKFLLLTSTAFTAGHFLLLFQSLTRKPEALPEMAIIGKDEIPVGGSKLFEYPEGSPARLLIRLSEDQFVAYEQQCTHLLCPVIPHVEIGELHCPCHEGAFDLMTGRPISGPPNRPLAKVILEVRGDTVYATGIQERTL
jgi:Rieske Fe-S protein